MPVLIGGASYEQGASQGVAFVLDLTERKAAEETLRIGEGRYRGVRPFHALRVCPETSCGIA